jgi:hypothetical protein
MIGAMHNCGSVDVLCLVPPAVLLGSASCSGHKLGGEYLIEIGIVRIVEVYLSHHPVFWISSLLARPRLNVKFILNSSIVAYR